MSFTFTGRLLSATESRNWLAQSLSSQSSSIELLSAYITETALRAIGSLILQYSPSASVRILARWKKQDIVTGASDLAAFEYAASKNWSFYIKQDFHGKLYKIGKGGVLVGSPNLTASGLALTSFHNDEIATVIPTSESTNLTIDNIFANSVLVTDALFATLSESVKSTENQKAPANDWPNEIKILLASPTGRVETLFLDECLFSADPQLILLGDFSSSSTQHDMSLLGLCPNATPTVGELRRQFKQSKLYVWLLQQLHEHHDELYFGKVSKLLHDTLLTQPTPHRTEVKDLISNLFSWIAALDDSLTVDRPRYSARIRLTE